MKISTRNSINAITLSGNLKQSRLKYGSVLLIMVLMLCSTVSVKAQTFIEDFSYTASTLLTATGNWNAHSGAGTNALTVTSPGLTYTGHPGSGTGLAVGMTTSGEDCNRPFTAITTGSVYASCLVNVSAATAAGDYSSGLYLNSSTFPTRLYIKTSGAGFVFGVSKSSATASYESTVRNFNQTYFVIVNYTFNGAAADDIVNLWVEPVIGASEPAATVSVGAGTADLASISAFYLRQGAAASSSTQRYDAIRVGTTWAQVNPPAATPPVVTPASPTGTVGTAFSYNIVATNSPTTYAISSGTLPAGLTLNTGPGVGAGTISGTPTTAGGPTVVNVTATNGAGTSSPAALTFTINPGNQTITGLPATDTRTYGDAPYNLSATGGGSGNPVTYSSSPGGVVTFIGNQVTIIGAGTTTITASQAGNSDWNAAPDVTQSLTVNKAAQTIIFGPLINRNDVDPNFQLTATGGGSGNQVTYTSSNTSVATIVDVLGNLDPNGTYVDIVGPGTTTITASQAGNANYFAAAPVQQVQTIINTSLLNQVITFNALPNKTYGDGDFQLTATGGGSGNPVTYTSSQASVAIIVDNLGNPDPNGSYVKIIGPGTTSITANQAGNGSYNAALPVSQNFTVDQKHLTVTGASVVSRPYDGTLAATITGGSLVGVISPDIVNIATSTGTFTDPNANNNIPVNAALTLGGADQVKYILDQPSGLTGNITQASQTITFDPLVNKSPGDPNFNYNASSNSGLPVSYSSSNTAVLTIVSGSLVHVGVIGSSTITASQAGNQNYLPATPVQQTQNVVAATPVSIFANLINDANPSLANPFTAGQTFDPQITVSGIGRGAGLLAASASNRYNASGFSLTTIDLTDYFEFTLTPNTGYRIDFSNFVYTGQRSTQGPNSFSFRSSVDGFTNDIGAPTATGATISLSAGEFQGVTSPITFRLYGYAAIAAGGTFSVNDFVFNGNVLVAPPTATYTRTNVSVCGGTNDGTITVVPSGTGPFTYSWTGITGSGNPATTPFSAGNVNPLTGLGIGYYNVTVTDANLNTATITGIHIENAFSVYVTNSGSISSSCGNTGSIILYGNAGVLPYTYSVVPGNNPSGVYQASNTFTDLAAGSYTAYVKDAAGCVSSKSITVAAAPALVVQPFVRNASSCGSDGSIEIYRTGGIPPFSYSLDDITYITNTNKFLNLPAGNYTAWVKDSKGCTASQAVVITQGAALNISAQKTNTSTCQNDGTIQLNASGGVPPYTYSLDDITYQASNSFTGLGANSYTGYVKDSKGCIGGPLNITINLNPIVVTAFTVPASNCLATNGSIQLFRTGGTGPYTYSLDGNNYQASNLFTGLTPNYYIGYVKDVYNCIGELQDIYVGPDCGQKANAGITTRGAGIIQGTTNGQVKVTAYPNPAATEFTLLLEGYADAKVSVVVTDIMGRTMYRAEGSGKQLFKFGNKFIAGLYNVQVTSGNDKRSVRIVKE